MNEDSKQQNSRTPQARGGSAKKPTPRKRTAPSRTAPARTTRAKTRQTLSADLRTAEHSNRNASSSRRRTTRSPYKNNGMQRGRSTRSSERSNQITFKERVMTSRPTLVAIAIVIVVAILGIVDMAANAGKAFGNVTIGEVNVSGLTSQEIQDTLRETYSPRISHAQVTIYARESEPTDIVDEYAEQEARAIAEQLSVEEAGENTSSWQADSLSLKANIPYEALAEEALAVGRSDGGIAARLGLLFGAHEVPLAVSFDEESLETLASDIDRTIGDPRIDTTVVIEDGKARVVEGHSGILVDRAWLSSMLSNLMLSGEEVTSFVAQASEAKSRITLEQAQEMADCVNRAIAPGATFVYHGKGWHAGAADLGSWTRISIDKDGEAYKLNASIDSGIAVPAVVKGADAVITSENMTVTFEDSDSGMLVHTEGTGNIPEVSDAVESLNQSMYGEGGRAWTGSPDDISIEVLESDRPESISFEQALDLGIITVIGEYTTEFSTLEGTENRNHNIRLAADILDNAIITADGGQWDFNDRSGNTNEEAGFWSAGSIVNGEYVDSIGGGICQVATTIFNAAYEAGMNIVERHNHSLYIASYPTGRDAAVDYPTMTLVWQNDQPSDILMKMSYSDGSVTATLYSVYTGYTVATETGEWLEGAKYSTRFEVDDAMGAGYYRKTVGEDGQSVSITRTVFDDEGNELSVETFHSVYEAKDEVYVVGPDTDRSALVRTDA